MRPGDKADEYLISHIVSIRKMEMTPWYSYCIFSHLQFGKQNLRIAIAKDGTKANRNAGDQIIH